MIDDNTEVEAIDTIDDAASDDNNVGLNEGIAYADAVCKSLA